MTITAGSFLDVSTLVYILRGRNFLCGIGRNVGATWDDLASKLEAVGHSPQSCQRGQSL